MLILKLTIVPLFIAAITLAGRRWGAGIAGTLGGLPIVAGPIVVFVALEQGVQFGALAATAAISAIAGLLVFGIAYCWASIRWPWPVALICAIGAWFCVAAGLATLPALPEVALVVAGITLVLAPRLLPPGGPVSAGGENLIDLPYRMITGAMLTLAVTTSATTLGAIWSGLFAVFPIIGLVLAVFTHRAMGAGQVALMFQGMINGLYSFAVFFLVLTILWAQVDTQGVAFWSACVIAAGAGVVVQVIVQGFLSLKLNRCKF